MSLTRSAKKADPDALKTFVAGHSELIGRIEIAGIDEPFTIVASDVEKIAGKYLRGSGCRANLSAHRSSQGRGAVHHRSVDG